MLTVLYFILIKNTFYSQLNYYISQTNQKNYTIFLDFLQTVMTEKIKTQQKQVQTQHQHTNSPPQPFYYMFRGHKKKASQFNKTKMLKTKHLMEKQLKTLRYDHLDSQMLQLDQQNQQSSTKKVTQQTVNNIKNSLNIPRRAKSHFQIIKSSPMQKLQSIRRNLSTNDDKLMITTSRMEISSQQEHRKYQMQKRQKQQSQTGVPKFYSRNLHDRMNEYLNLVVAKSSQDHQQKLKKMKQDEIKYMNQLRITNKQKETKMFVRNKFLRELKARSVGNKKNQFLLQCRQNSNQRFNKSLTSRTQHNDNFVHSNKDTSRANLRGIQDGEQLINLANQVLSISMRVNLNLNNNQFSNKTPRLKTNHTIKTLANTVHTVTKIGQRVN